MDLVSKEDYLEHHQKRGAHWGVRNGPPYPLDRTPSGRISKKQEKDAARLARKNKKQKESSKQGNDRYSQEDVNSKSNTIRKVLAEKAYILTYKIAPNAIKPPKETPEQIEWVKMTSEMLDARFKAGKIRNEMTELIREYHDADIDIREWPKDVHDKYFKLMDEEKAANAKYEEIKSKRPEYPTHTEAERNPYYRLLKVKT